MNIIHIAQQAHDLFQQAPFIARIDNPQQYNAALELVDYVLQLPEFNQPLVSLLAASIAQWENTAPEFAEFNQRLADMEAADSQQGLIE